MTKDEALRMALDALEHEAEIGNDDAYRKERDAIRKALAQPEFTKHEVENADDWSEWVCPDPKGYLMKCCDCGLVHEAQFGVVRYKSETEREDCDMVDDPNLQAVFRMRRSEQWSPEDRAYRPGGLAQPEPVQCEPQEAVTEDGWCDWVCPKPTGYLMQCCDCGLIHEVDSRVAKYEPRPSEMFEVVNDPDLQVQWRMKRRDDISPKHPRQWQGLTDDEIALICGECAASAHKTDDISYARAIEAKLKEKNT